jgi:hypothetical protein
MMLQIKFEVKLPSSFREEDVCRSMTTGTGASPLVLKAHSEPSVLVIKKDLLPSHEQIS